MSELGFELLKQHYVRIKFADYRSQHYHHTLSNQFHFFFQNLSGHGLIEHLNSCWLLDQKHNYLSAEQKTKFSDNRLILIYLRKI